MTPETVFWRRMERDNILKEVIKASQEVDRVALIYGELYEFLGDRRDKHSRAAMASIGIAVIGNRLARDPKRMACGKHALPGSFEHLVSRVVRIDAARGLSVPVDCFGKFDRVVHRLVENRMQKVDEGFHPRVSGVGRKC